MVGQANGAEVGDNVARIGFHRRSALFKRKALEGFRQRLLHHVGPVFAEEDHEVGVEAAREGAFHDLRGVGLAVGAVLFHPEAHAEFLHALRGHAREQVGLLAVPGPGGARLLHVEGIVGIHADTERLALGGYDQCKYRPQPPKDAVHPFCPFVKSTPISSQRP